MNISRNIYIAEDPNFGIYDKEKVRALLMQVQIDFARWIDGRVFQTSNCHLFYQDSHPTIYSFGALEHRICLHVKGDDWWRWVYQFAHEYCHHLINGAMSGDITGLIWFEETICDLASICHLDRLIERCDALQIDKVWVKSCRIANLGTVQNNCWEYLESVMPQLTEPRYHREIYSNLATTMLPLFSENPNLWKIILYFGDMRTWNSLEDLFAHLRATADASYSVSLGKLHRLLLGEAADA